MAPRRSHHKSRHGCLTCKRRRVKCDETGPPCANCKARQTACEYVTPASEGSSVSPLWPGQPSTPSASSARTTPADRAQLGSRNTVELQLLHRYTTATYLTISTEICDDYLIWQQTVPEVALGYDFLLDTLFAFTAFDMTHAHPGHASQWRSTALEYETLAYARFRSALIDPTPDCHDALLYCSILLLVLAMASATLSDARESTVQHTLVVHSLIKGCTIVVAQKPNCLQTHSLWRKMPSFFDLQKSDLDPDTEKALATLEDANAQRSLIQPAHYTACKTALVWARYLFRTCSDLKHRSFCLGFVNMGGQDYIDALNADDPLALAILVAWAVMLHPLSEDYWYAEGFGKRLISEISHRLKNRDVAGFAEVLEWAEREVEKMEERRSDSHSPLRLSVR